jgi:hypothetical protein
MAINLIDKDNNKLTEKDLLSQFKRNAKRYHGEFQTKRGVSFICVHDNSYIDDFYRIIKSTEDRQGISLRSKDYFLKIMDSFKEDAYMYIARVDVDKFISFLNNEIEKEKDENLEDKNRFIKNQKLKRIKSYDIIPYFTDGNCWACNLGCSVSTTGYSPMNFSPYDNNIKRRDITPIKSGTIYEQYTRHKKNKKK